jgi:hypothetical protein
MKRENNERTDSVLHATKALGANVRSIVSQPVILCIGMLGIVDIGQLAESPPEIMSPRPTYVYVLWKEYELGICGRKHAKDFNEREGGQQDCFMSSQARFSGT